MSNWKNPWIHADQCNWSSLTNGSFSQPPSPESRIPIRFTVVRRNLTDVHARCLELAADGEKPKSIHYRLIQEFGRDNVPKDSWTVRRWLEKVRATEKVHERVSKDGSTGSATAGVSMSMWALGRYGTGSASAAIPRNTKQYPQWKPSGPATPALGIRRPSQSATTSPGGLRIVTQTAESGPRLHAAIGE